MGGSETGVVMWVGEDSDGVGRMVEKWAGGVVWCGAMWVGEDDVGNVGDVGGWW